MGNETVRAALNENFCFMRETEQGLVSDKVPGRTMKGQGGKAL